MSVVALLTDFGLQDAYVGIMKSVILSVNPDVSIIDISHDIEPWNIAKAAYVLKSAFKYIPPKTVCAVVVDPGVGSDRAILGAEISGKLFLSPDNGILPVLLDTEKCDTLVRVENRDLFLPEVSPTFHGRDVFAPVAAHLAGGVPLADTGTKIDCSDVLRLDFRKPVLTENSILEGSVTHADHFGNIITNIGRDDIFGYCSLSGDDDVQSCIVIAGGIEINGITMVYSSVETGSLLAIIGSSGFLEISVNCGNAQEILNLTCGDIVSVKK